LKKISHYKRNLKEHLLTQS